MDLMNYIKHGISAFTLKKESFEINKNESLFGISFLVLVIIGAILIGIEFAGSYMFPDPEILTATDEEILNMGVGGLIVTYLFAMFFYIFFYAIVIGIDHLFLKLFGGKGSFKQTAISTVSAFIVPMMCNIIISILLYAMLAISPIVGGFFAIFAVLILFAVSIWGLVVLVYILCEVHQLSGIKVLLSVLVLPFVVFFIFFLVLVLIIVALFGFGSELI